MKKIYLVFIALLLINRAPAEQLKWSVGSVNQKITDIDFEFGDQDEGLIKVHIDQATAKGTNILFNLQESSYDYGVLLEWLSKLISSEVKGVDVSIQIYDENIDLKSSVDRVLFELTNIDVAIDERGNNTKLNSLNGKFSISNFKFFLPTVNDPEADEVLRKVNRAIPDGKITKMELGVNYSQSNNLLEITGILRMLGGSANLDIVMLIDEQSAERTYVKNATLKLQNLSDGMMELVDVIEKETTVQVTKAGRNSARLEFSGPIEGLPENKYDNQYLGHEIKSIISGIEHTATMYYQTYGEWPQDIEQLEYTGQIDLDRSTKLKWTFVLQMPDRIIATSTENMPAGAGKITIYNARTGEFFGYGSSDY